ncbi:hypothetical protein [Clostridium lacusfryxellense]|uniref:hypothetical protein n=1 Tax=Clostridium lacusfryxellense TaxID=205328 RepID=UPI001C0DAF23|nr:hypothetical protein [Clostridium lacusfryxellense]MBU3111851.1 hypothetical protein [Clostridium lacusfryxellense]
MTENILTIISVVINLAVVAAIIVVVSRALQMFKNLTAMNKKIYEKIDVILDKLENKEDK